MTEGRQQTQFKQPDLKYHRVSNRQDKHLSTYGRPHRGLSGSSEPVAHHRELRLSSPSETTAEALPLQILASEPRTSLSTPLKDPDDQNKIKLQQGIFLGIFCCASR